MADHRGTSWDHFSPISNCNCSSVEPNGARYSFLRAGGRFSNIYSPVWRGLLWAGKIERNTWKSVSIIVMRVTVRNVFYDGAPKIYGPKRLRMLLAILRIEYRIHDSDMSSASAGSTFHDTVKIKYPPTLLKRCLLQNRLGKTRSIKIETKIRTHLNE